MADFSRRASSPSEIGPIPSVPVITALQSSDTLNSGSPLTITWTPGNGDEIRITAAANAFGTISFSGIDDDGIYPIPGSTLAAGPTVPHGLCNMTITVTRVNKTFVNPAFEGGTIEAKSSATVTMKFNNP